MKEYTLTLPVDYTPPPLPGRDEWITALRSGDYVQARGKLQNGASYCCLGVLCKLQGRLRNGHDGPVEDDYTHGLHMNNQLRINLKSEGVLPDNLSLKIDINWLPSLAAANDSGLSFSQIADIIEQVWSDGGPLPTEQTTKD